MSTSGSGSGDGPGDLDEAVRSMLLLIPRLVGRAKRLPIPAQLEGFNLAPRHLSLLAYLQFDGALTIGELASRLEVAPTTVSLMVGDLSRQGVLVRTEDEVDRRRTYVSIAPELAEAVTSWLSGSAAAWQRTLGPLSAAERSLVVGTLKRYEAELDAPTTSPK